MCVHVCVCVRTRAYNIVQVDVGPPPNELLYYLQIALLCCHHQGSLSVLEQVGRALTHCDTHCSPPTIQLISLFTLEPSDC